MLNFEVKITKTGKKVLATSLSGKPLLTTPQLNKGTAFTSEERIAFNLLGKLPARVETLDEQVIRAYRQFAAYHSNLQCNIYLNNLHDKNQVLFYKMVSQHLDEMLPKIYTPIVGTAVKKFSQEFRQPRGLYISYPDMDNIPEILDNRSNPEIDLIVVTDGEGVLGIGDQGVGGMDIPVAKLMVYSLCGGIDPTRTLPILLDVGTNNQALLEDPFYLGWRHPRMEGKEYDAFIEKFIEAIRDRFPNVFLHWEDFGRANARRILMRYQDELCTFNDDIQGTGSVALAAILAGTKKTGQPLTQHRVLVFGAGTAGTGIADQICDAMIRHGLSETDARKQFWLIDRKGLVMTNSALTPGQQLFARDPEELKDWSSQETNLENVVKQIKPTILIGCSAVKGAFSKSIVKSMASHCERPIIFPLSNPTERCEAKPENLIEWTDGKALIATGSPFAPVSYQNCIYTIAQCNNALVFPGIGLGVQMVKAKRLTSNMIWAATGALARCSPHSTKPGTPLLPSLNDAPMVAKAIAEAVAKEAMREGHALDPIKNDLRGAIEKAFWIPEYLPFVRA